MENELEFLFKEMKSLRTKCEETNKKVEII
jgi:hypothetical protein